MIAFEYETPGDGTQDIWIYDLDQETFSRLTFEGAINRYPFWSPDGSEVGFASDRDYGFSALYSRPVDLSGETRLLFGDPDDTSTEGSWTPDGRWLVHRWGSGGSTEGATEDLRYAAPGSDSAAVVILDTPATERNPSVSPDGRWLAYTSNESGRAEVYVRALPRARRPVAGLDRWWINPVWARNGRELLYISDSDPYPLVTAAVRTEPDFAVESRQELFATTGHAYAPQHPQWDLSPDGQRLLVLASPEGAEEAGRYVIVENFSEELKRLVPN